MGRILHLLPEREMFILLESALPVRRISLLFGIQQPIDFVSKVT
jgi:hypothetical protein